MQKSTKLDEEVLARLKRVKKEMKPVEGRGFVSISEAISRLLDFYEIKNRE